MDELTIGDKIYISSKRAAAITGYAKDYVGQLCREGHIEAKMVGRSWYVLESSIREHRFGKPEEKPVIRGVQETASVEKTEQVPAWEAPRYIPEESPKIPELAPSAPDLVVADASEGHESLTEMQAAWKEWFESRREPRLEAPEVIEAREEAREEEEAPEPPEAPETKEEAVPITVHKIEIPQPPSAAEMYVPQRLAEAPVRPSIDRRAPRRRKARRGGSLVATALMIVLAGIVILVGVIGSGFGGTYVQNNAVAEFLGGTSSINK